MTTPCLEARPTEDTEPTYYDLSDVTDHLRVMRNQEETTYTRDNTNTNDSVNPEDRRRLMICQWCYQVVDFCKLQRETVSIAISILDRYLSTPQGQEANSDVRHYPLAAMTALYISIKMNETVAVDIKLMEQAGRNAYSTTEFEKMEIRMITALGWRLNRPTPLAFLRCFVALIPQSIDPAVKMNIMDRARHIVELSVFEKSLCNRLSSEIATAVIVDVIMEADRRSFPEEMKAEFIFFVERSYGLEVNSITDTKSDLNFMLGQRRACNKRENSILAQASSESLARSNSPVSVARRKHCVRIV